MRQNLDRFKLRWRDRLDGWGSADQGALERKYRTELLVGTV